MVCSQSLQWTRRRLLAFLAAGLEDRRDFVVVADHDQIHLVYVAKPSARIDLVAALYRNTFFRNWHKLQSINGIGISSVLDDPITNAAELARSQWRAVVLSSIMNKSTNCVLALTKT